MSALPKPEIDVCHACGKLFPRAYMKLCSTCAVVEENRFQLIREYLQNHDTADVQEIAAGTGVSRGDIARFKAEGRLVDVGLGDGIPNVCTCEPGGERCPKCRHELARAFGDMAKEMRHDNTMMDDGRPVRYVRRERRIGDS